MLNTETLSPQEISIETLLEKYAKGNEKTIIEVQKRVAKALASVEESPENWEYKFLQAQIDGFVLGGRINSAAGTDINATLINCFVQPIGDSISEFENNKPSIYQALLEAAETMRRGGGVGYDFSKIRPSTAFVKGTHSRSSGPVSFMKVFDASCATVESAGARRGAQMGLLRCDHPDIEIFVQAKSKGELSNFNISIGVTDEFMRAVEADESFDLVHDAKPQEEIISSGAYQRADGKWVYNSVKAKEIWHMVMTNTYNAAEPGIIFIDKMNQENNLYYCEKLETVNPCAEQCLPDYGCCCLGSINLTKFVHNAFNVDAFFDYEKFSEVISVSVRMLDNVLDVTYWPLEQQKNEAMNKRRIGLGFLGLGSALMMLGLRYDSEEGRNFATQVAQTLRDVAYESSAELAISKGSFPMFESDKYLQSQFISRFDNGLKEKIAKGMRNSHLLSIAPTGTIALAFADNASNGIEPAFSYVYNRKKVMKDGTKKIFRVSDHAYRLYEHKCGAIQEDSQLPDYFVTALDMSALSHMKMLEVVQPYIDSAISKTVNVPENYPFSDFESLYLNAWKAGLKGIATYRPNNVTGSVLSVDNSSSHQNGQVSTISDINPLKLQFDGRPIGDLDSVTSKIQYTTYEGKKTVYLTVSFIKVSGVANGKKIEIERPFEFFMPAGQKTEGQQWISASMRLLSMAARSGGSVAKALNDMREVVWDKNTVRCGFIEKLDGTKVPLHHESEVAAIGYSLQRILIKRGFLDADGNQVPVEILANNFSSRFNFEEIQKYESEDQLVATNMAIRSSGKKCNSCGAYAVQKIDGCQRCVACGEIGSCS